MWQQIQQKINTHPKLIIISLVSALSITFVVFAVVTVLLIMQVSNINQTNTNLSSELEVQKKLRDEVRDVWEEQAILNDQLVKSQNQLISDTISYQATLVKGIRFVGGTSQFTPELSQAQIKEDEQKLYDSLVDLNQLTDVNARKKQEYTDKINKLYKLAEEDQNRRANPRDGVR